MVPRRRAPRQRSGSLGRRALTLARRAPRLSPVRPTALHRTQNASSGVRARRSRRNNGHGNDAVAEAPSRLTPHVSRHRGRRRRARPRARRPRPAGARAPGLAHRGRAADGEDDPGHEHRGVREEVPRVQGEAAGARLGRSEHQAARLAGGGQPARPHPPEPVHDRVALHEEPAPPDGRADPRSRRERHPRGDAQAPVLRRQVLRRHPRDGRHVLLRAPRPAREEGHQAAGDLRRHAEALRRAHRGRALRAPGAGREALHGLRASGGVARVNGGTWVDAKTWRPQLNSKSMLEILDYLQKLNKFQPAGWSGQKYLDTQAALATGKIAMSHLAGARAIGYIEKYAPENMRDPEHFRRCCGRAARPGRSGSRRSTARTGRCSPSRSTRTRPSSS